MKNRKKSGRGNISTYGLIKNFKREASASLQSQLKVDVMKRMLISKRRFLSECLRIMICKKNFNRSNRFPKNPISDKSGNRIFDSKGPLHRPLLSFPKQILQLHTPLFHP